jgi:peptidoglycan/xylan/chitin deacetylase (PgdA/CDA1 family)
MIKDILFTVMMVASRAKGFMGMGSLCQKVVRHAISATIPRQVTTWIFRQQRARWPLSKKVITCISFDCDLEEDIASLPSLVQLLRELQIQASFACVGAWVKKYPREHSLLLENGHEIVNHTYSHPNHPILAPHSKFNTIGPEQQEREIVLAHQVCREYLEYEPVGFRTPHFGALHTSSVYPILARLGYKYSSSTLAGRVPMFGLPFRIAGIWELPLSPSPEDPFGCLETWFIYRSPNAHHNEEYYCRLLETLMNICFAEGVFLNLYFDPVDVVRMESFPIILERIRRDDRQVLLRYCDLINCI